MQVDVCMLQVKPMYCKLHEYMVTTDLIFLVAIKLQKYNVKILLRQFLKLWSHHLAWTTPAEVWIELEIKGELFTKIYLQIENWTRGT